MNDFDIDRLLAIGIGLIISLFVFLIVIYVVLGIVLNKLNKKIYGRSTALAWLPFCNIYLLGKLTVNKLFGYLLLIMMLLNSKFTITNGSNVMVYGVIPDSYRGIYTIVYGVLFVILFIFAIIKINKLGKNEETYINEVYLNQKTKQEIMEEDEEVKLVKWDDSEEQEINKKEEINNIPFQNFVNTNEPVETKNEVKTEEENNLPVFNTSFEEKPNISNEDLEKPIENNTIYLEKHDDINEEYDYDNPKIQEAIDEIIHKEENIPNQDNN